MKNNWYVILGKKTFPRLRVICYPYAGGGISTYTSWVKMFPEDIEIVVAQPPGRSNRIAEDPIMSMDLLTDELCRNVKSLLNIPYVFFGHSLGARVAYEVMHKLEKNGCKLPAHFFASGSSGPRMKIERCTSGDLSDADFCLHIKALGGTPEAFLENRELLELYLPVLRADFKISEEYRCKRKNLMNVRATIFGGNEDKDIPLANLQAWQECFESRTVIRTFAGGHFFIETNRSEVIKEIQKIVSSIF